MKGPFMKCGSTGLAALIIVVSSMLVAERAQALDSNMNISGAQEFITLLSEQKYREATAGFDSTMKAAMSPEKLAETWQMLQSQAGLFKRQMGTRTEESGGYEIVIVTSEFENAAIDIKVVYNTEGRISGLWFAPAQAATQYESPSYVNAKVFRKTEVTVGEGDWALPGTLTVPWGDKPAPVVVLVHGSGPNDRNESIGPNKVFRDLAEGLSSNGIAVLRYDKRTLTHRNKIMAIAESLTVKEETIDDALAAVDLLRKTRGIDTSRIFVLGHSLGGTLIPRIAKEDPSIAGLIIMAGMARPLEDVVVEQVTYILSLNGTISPAEQQQLDSLKAQVALVKSQSLSKSTPADQLPLGLPASYWLDLRGYEPARMAVSLTQPLLILQGERDYQVTKDDFQIWKNELAKRSNVEFKLYPKLNHLFIEGEGKITPDEYNASGHVAESVIKDITEWIMGQ
jgi:hypothetical protein